MTIPRYVVGTAAEATQILHRLARSGWHPRPGFTVPPSAGPAVRIVCYGRIPTQSAAQAAASAAIRGAGVVAIADSASQMGRQLIAALELHGPVLQSADMVAEPARMTALPTMTAEMPVVNGVASLLPEQRALLGRLANGETIATAAAAEYLSLRTANRRIAQARTSLGVHTTREAVLVFLHQRRPD
jgi:DNA-binding NarL/FixJ family response regulator